MTESFSKDPACYGASNSHSPARSLPKPIVFGLPVTALAPMQDVTDLPFMAVINRYGPPDYFFTEYFRVHAHSRPERHILASITENQTGRPVFAQMIGECPDLLGRMARELEQYPVAGVDLNMGCPAPKIYKKNVGGGLLRDVAKVDLLLGRLREAISGLFTVKMRIGFEDTENFEPILDLINKHQVDLLSLHGRTVKEGYRSEVHYDFIARAVERVNCPVQANGNITSATRAAAVARETGCFGLMIGRSAIRNPWIFRQVREKLRGLPVFQPTLTEVRGYIGHLYAAIRTDKIPERALVSKMKKYLNFVGQGVDPEGRFLHDMRRAQTEAELFTVCDSHLLQDGSRLFADEPYPGVIARPNCEAPVDTSDGCRL
jgi:tRNA-dihydrouridine synthase B